MVYTQESKYRLSINIIAKDLKELEEFCEYIKSADKMFEDLGFDIYEDNVIIRYEGIENSHEIVFEKDRKVVSSRCGVGTEHITMQELHAINKKCEELGWL